MEDVILQEETQYRLNKQNTAKSKRKYDVRHMDRSEKELLGQGNER